MKSTLPNPKITVDEYFKIAKNSSNLESSSSYQKSSTKNQPISVIKIKVEMPKILNDIQMKLIHDYQQIES